MYIPVLNALIALTVLSGGLAAAENVIVHANSPITELSEDDLRDYYLGRKTSWPDGSKVVVIVLKDGPSHDNLMKRLGKNGSQFITGWKKLVFTGKGAMPEQVGDENELITQVAKIAGAIGYVDASKVTDGVKVISVK